MGQFIKLLDTTGVRFTKDVRGFSPSTRGDGDCVCDNCSEGFGACECNCDCADE